MEINVTCPYCGEKVEYEVPSNNGIFECKCSSIWCGKSFYLALKDSNIIAVSSNFEKLNEQIDIYLRMNNAGTVNNNIGANTVNSNDNISTEL